MNREELEAVIGHEVSSHALDIRISTIAVNSCSVHYSFISMAVNMVVGAS